MDFKETHFQIFGLAMIFYVVTTLGFSAFVDLITAEAKKNVARQTS